MDGFQALLLTSIWLKVYSDTPVVWRMVALFVLLIFGLLNDACLENP